MSEILPRVLPTLCVGGLLRQNLLMKPVIVVAFDAASEAQITKPEMTKKMSTPTKPPGSQFGLRSAPTAAPGTQAHRSPDGTREVNSQPAHQVDATDDVDNVQPS